MTEIKDRDLEIQQKENRSNIETMQGKMKYYQQEGRLIDIIF